MGNYLLCNKRNNRFIYSNNFRFTSLSNNKIKYLKDKEFSLKYQKYKANDLLEKSYKANDINEKISLLEKSLEYNNTNEITILNYLNALKNSNNKNFNNQLEFYKNALSSNNYFKYNKTNKISSKENLKIFIEKFLNFNFRSLTSRYEIIKFFSNDLKCYEPNVDFKYNDNKELYIFLFYDRLFSFYSFNILNNLRIILKDKKLSFEEKLDKYCDDDSKELLNLILNEGIKKNDNIIIYCSKIFNTIERMGNYFNLYKDIIFYCINNLNEENLYVLQYLFYDAKFFYLNKEYEINPKTKYELFDFYQSKTNPNYDKNILNEVNKINLIKVTKKGDSLLIKLKENEITIKDYKKYYIKDFIEKVILYKIKNKKLYEIYLLQFVKLQYFNKINYIRFCDKYIEKFLKAISTSKTIISLLNFLFPGFSNYEEFKFENWFPNFIVEIYKNSTYFNIDSIIGAESLKTTVEVHYFIPNRNRNKNKNMEIIENIFIYIVVNLSFFIYTLDHESIGHIIIIYLNLLTMMNYESPRNFENEKESGNYIESLLFNERKKKYSLEELMYIIDIENYNVDYNDFRKNFLNVNEKYIPSSKCIEMLNEIGLDYNLFIKIYKNSNKEKPYYSLFNIKNYNHNNKFKGVTFKNCYFDHAEYSTFMKLFKKEIINEYGNFDNFFIKKDINF